MTDHLTDRQRVDLDVARALVAAGVPLFLAQPDASSKTGYRPPRHWERSPLDPGVVDQWEPGLALCAVMGCGLDLVDVDPRNGGDLRSLDGMMPIVYGLASTPSGGHHLFVRSLFVGSRDNIFAGIDVKGGLPDGAGRGFAFLAPTVRASVVTGEPAAYQWIKAPDIDAMAAEDRSGAGLAERIRSLRTGSTAKQHTAGPDWWQAFLASREPQSAPAAERAIASKVAEVAEWSASSGAGFRQVLLRAALTLGGYVGGGYLDEDIARKRLEEAVSAVWGSPDANDLLWVQQGLDDGAASPFHVYTADDDLRRRDAYGAAPDVGGSVGGGVGDDSGGDHETPHWSVYHAIGLEAFEPRGGTDQEIAEEVVARMFPAMRFASDAGTWLVRGAQVWRERDDLTGWATATLGRLMPLGDPDLPKNKADYTEAHWAAARRNRFMNATPAAPIERKVRALVRAGDHPAVVTISALDADPEVLWAGGVPWDLRASGDVPTPAAIDVGTPHLRTALCAPDPTCATTRWDAYIAAVWPDVEVRAWALRVLSIALTGYPDAALPVLYGPERSGKTSLVEMLVTVLGSYAHAASPKLLSAQEMSHPEMVYDLKGRRLSFIDEGPRRGHDATERLKQITGGGSLTGRAMRANSVTFTPSHTLVMTTNPEPHLTDPALRARMRLIPCDATESDVRPARLALLGRGLLAEAPGILAAMMRETAAYLADRDSASNASAPLVIGNLVRQLAEGQDPVRQWVEDCTVPADPGTQGRVLYDAFARWHQDHPLYRKTVIPSVTSVGRTLTEMGYPSRHKNNGSVRPLEVLGWTRGAMPTAPTPATFLGHLDPTAKTSDTSVTGSGQVGRPVDPEPVTDQNSRSEPVFSSSSDGLMGTSTTHREKIEDIENTHIKTTEEYGNYPSSVIPSPPTLSDVARRATSAQITKAEARRLLKEEARQASMRAAAGETMALPVVVDREGHLVPVSIAQAMAVVRSAMVRSAALTVDVETTGYAVGHGDYALRSVQLGDATAAVVFHPTEHADVVRGLLAEAPALHAHSATADLVPLAHAGLIDPEAGWDRMHDTVIPAKLADPASTGSDPGLKQLAATVLGDAAVAPVADAARSALFKAGRWLTDTKGDTPIERSGWAQVDTRCATMLRYAASDVLDTGALARRLPPVPPAIYERERLAQRMTARIAHVGIRLDADRVADLREQHTAARAEAAGRVRAHGVENPGSDVQVGVAAAALGAQLPSTATGRPSVAAGVLEPLRAAEGPLGDFVAAVLDHRHHDTVLGLFLEPYRQLCERGDGRARPTVYTLGADTGRMSCTRPNLQQLPRVGGVRACLTADPGQLMIGADFSGVEIRVAAALSQDANLRQMLADGRDLHAEIARLVWGPDATKAHRYKAKPMVFQRIYGGSVKGLARQAGVTLAVAQAVVDALDSLTPQLSAWSDHISRAARRGETHFVSYSGRVIHLPRDRPHAAPNFAIQGSARELLVDALVRWRDTRWGSCPLLPVHDELDVFVPAEDAEQATAELVRCMQSELFGIRIDVEPAAPSFAWADSA